MKRFIPILSLALVLSGCGTSGTSQAEESFIAGSGAVTTIKEGSRQKAPAISGMTLSGNNYSFAGGRLRLANRTRSGGHNQTRLIEREIRRFY